MTLPSLSDYNGWTDYWRNKVGLNVIPAVSTAKKPIVEWKEWQTNPIPEELHNQWKSKNTFSEGMAVICGKVWHRADKTGYYFAYIDTDNEIAAKEFSISGDRTLVEVRKDKPYKRHSCIYSQRSIKKKASDVTPNNPGLVSKIENN